MRHLRLAWRQLVLLPGAASLAAFLLSAGNVQRRAREIVLRKLSEASLATIAALRATPAAVLKT